MFKANKTRSAWIRKRFRIDKDNFAEAIYNMLLGESESEEERRNLSTPKGLLQLDNQGSYVITNLDTPSPPSPPAHTSTPPPPPSPSPHTPTPPPPPPPFNMANVLNMLFSKGQGLEDIKQFSFVVEAVWKAQQINDEDVKKSQLFIEL